MMLEITEGMVFTGKDPSGDVFTRTVERMIVGMDNGNVVPQVVLVMRNESGGLKDMSFAQVAKAVQSGWWKVK